MPRRKNHLTFKIFFFLFSIDLLETLTQFCFKKSTTNLGYFFIRNPHELLNFIKNVASTPFLWIGFFSVLLTFIAWSTILSKIDLSVAVPICSFSYVTIPLVSIFVLHEEMTLLDWTGILFIIIGVILISISTTRREEQVIP